MKVKACMYLEPTCLQFVTLKKLCVLEDDYQQSRKTPKAFVEFRHKAEKIPFSTKGSVYSDAVACTVHVPTPTKQNAKKTKAAKLRVC